MKKIFATIITLITVICLTVPVLANTYVCGDTNNDGVVDISDAVIVQRYIIKDIPYMPWNKAIRESGEPVPWEFGDIALCGDVNADGEVTIADAVIIERYVAKTIDTLPYVYLEDDAVEDTVDVDAVGETVDEPIKE